MPQVAHKIGPIYILFLITHFVVVIGITKDILQSLSLHGNVRILKGIFNGLSFAHLQKLLEPSRGSSFLNLFLLLIKGPDVFLYFCFIGSQSLIVLHGKLFNQTDVIVLSHNIVDRSIELIAFKQVVISPFHDL